MAAVTSLPKFLTEQEWNPNGHTTRIIETLQFFGVRLPFGFEKTFAFKCWEIPTSWGLRVTFYNVLMDGTVTCEITIRRLDNIPLDMGTDFWMRPLLPFQYPDLCTNVHRAEGMLPNHQAKRIIRFMPPEVLVRLGNLPLQVEVFFRIRRCHPDLGLAGLIGCVHQERFPPPLLFATEEMYVLPC